MSSWDQKPTWPERPLMEADIEMRMLDLADSGWLELAQGRGQSEVSAVTRNSFCNLYSKPLSLPAVLVLHVRRFPYKTVEGATSSSQTGQFLVRQR